MRLPAGALRNIERAGSAARGDDIIRMPRTDRARAGLRLAIATLVLAAATVLAFAFADRPFADFSHAVLHRPAAGVWLTYLAQLPDPLALATWLAAAIWAIARRPFGNAWRALLAAALAALLATVAVVLLKFLAGRPWPETWYHGNPSWIRNHVFGFFPLHGGTAYGSFPSGHTARMAAPCTVLGMRAPAWRWLAFLLPLLVAAGLLAADFHFVSDCLAGLLVGLLSGAAALRLLPPRR